LYDELDQIIDGTTDEDVVYRPHDPASQALDGAGWTLARVIAHLTATLEEWAARAANLARGVNLSGRPRYEVPWELITTADQLAQRFAESRRISLGFLDAWPDRPHLELRVSINERLSDLDAPAMLLVGQRHAASHFAQLREIRAQSAALPLAAD
jgi:hypothetical protein